MLPTWSRRLIATSQSEVRKRMEEIKKEENVVQRDRQFRLLAMESGKHFDVDCWMQLRQYMSISASLELVDDIVKDPAYPLSSFYLAVSRMSMPILFLFGHNIVFQTLPRQEQENLIQHFHEIWKREYLQKLCVIPFGLRNSDRDADTLCITYGDNGEHLLKHPYLAQSISAELAQVNGRHVETVPIAGAGLGLRAKFNIPARTLFVRERPLVLCIRQPSLSLIVQLPTFLDHMSPEERTAFKALHNCKPKHDDAFELLGIMRTNRFAVNLPFDKEGEHSAVFDTMSRANHSCVPNAEYRWHYDSFCGGFVSLRDIQQGEEITVSYTLGLLPAHERQAELQQKWSFRCTCRACTLPEEEQKESDRRRQQLGAYLLPQGSSIAEISGGISRLFDSDAIQDDNRKQLEFTQLMYAEGLLPWMTPQMLADLMKLDRGHAHIQSDRDTVGLI
ncbi:SET domain-containing protein [Calocera viscosa TUFC12733]|uniref:SET domain-containing protein n=1 Tax=Calocera viscosa (strain TUFC12733) TaxID=1330018 RepID=A0A167ML73_CALVF|nr:SET domain-containing protein [Calocera viscosa TUFC12733]